MTGARNQHGLSRRKQIFDGRFPGAVAVRGVHEHVGPIGLQQAPQAGFARGDQLLEPRVAVVHGLAMHGAEHFGGDVRGAGGVQETVAGDTAWAIAVHSIRVSIPRERQFSTRRGRALLAIFQAHAMAHQPQARPNGRRQAEVPDPGRGCLHVARAEHLPAGAEMAAQAPRGQCQLAALGAQALRRSRLHRGRRTCGTLM